MSYHTKKAWYTDIPVTTASTRYAAYDLADRQVVESGGALSTVTTMKKCTGEGCVYCIEGEGKS
jgi:hypothetical protein